MKNRFMKRCTAVFLVLSILSMLCGCKEEGSTAETTVSIPTELTLSTEMTAVPETEAPTQPTETQAQVYVPWYETGRLIYHAGGEIDGFTYSNSKEAVENCLSQGNRLLEIDFLFTSDGHLVCLHEWSNLQGLGGPVSLEKFLSLKMYQRFTTITAGDLIGYMRQYPDMYLITDTKEGDSCQVIQALLELCNYEADIVDRFVIQLYDGGIKARMQELYPFQDDNFLFTTYKFGSQKISAIMELCQEEGIRVITAPYGSWDRATVQKMVDEGFLIFEHTLNYTSMTDNALGRGIYGFYTDSLQPTDLEFG